MGTWKRRAAALISFAMLTTVPLVVTAAPALAVNPPTGFSDETIATNMWGPIGMEFSPDGRLFVLLGNGRIQLIKNDTVRPDVVDIPVVHAGSKGLLGMAFDPNFAANGHVFITYTTDDGGFEHTRLSRFTMTGDTISLGSEVVLRDLEDIEGKTMHQGGDLEFAQDGKILLPVGDNLIGPNAQDMTTVFGKVLRFNKDGSIPTDNPFYNTTSGLRRAIWATGVRNPWKSVTQPGTFRMFMSDVGSDAWEEVNEAEEGANYGWPDAEGDSSNPAHTDPVFTYPHSGGDPFGCAVTGGDFYDPQTASFPAEYAGDFFFGDHCFGWIRSLDLTTGVTTEFATGGTRLIDLKIHPLTGDLYYLDREYNGDNTGASGGVGKITYTGAAGDVTITDQPDDVSVSIGGDAVFTVSATGTPPLTYQWRRNGTNMAGETDRTLTVENVQPADDGDVFRVRVWDANGTVLSAPATLTVLSNNAPVPVIDTPPDGTKYKAGDTISFSGHAIDAEDGDIPPSGLAWEIRLFHDDHSHGGYPLTSGIAGDSYTIPNNVETSANVFYRIYLTATDSNGASVEVTRDLQPRKTTMTFETSPPGLSLTLDGSPISTPTDVVGVEGVLRLLGAPSPQLLNGTTYVFDSWSDGGTQNHEILTPVPATTYTANFVPATGATTAALVVGDLALGVGDTALENLMSASGLSVTMVEDDDVKDNGESAVAGYDLVVVASSTKVWKIKKRLKSVSVPVMVTKPWLFDDFGLTGTAADVDFGLLGRLKWVNVVDNTHPVTDGFPTGNLTVFTPAKKLAWGQPVATGDVLAKRNGKPVVFTYNDGAMLADGTFAAGCRVVFPAWKGAMGSATADGKALFTSAIEWMSGGCEAPPPTGDAGFLLVVGNAAQPTAGDEETEHLLGHHGDAVTVIDDDDLTAGDLAGIELVFVSSTVSSTAGIQTVLQTAPVPVIISKPWLYDNLKMTGPTNGVDYGVTTKVTGFTFLAGHSITDSLGTGDIDVYTVPQNHPFGLPGPEADVISTSAGNPGMFIYDAGDSLWNGDPAPACRIALPLYRNGLANLTAAGEQLFDEALHWATDACM